MMEKHIPGKRLLCPHFGLGDHTLDLPSFSMCVHEQRAKQHFGCLIPNRLFFGTVKLCHTSAPLEMRWAHPVTGFRHFPTLAVTNSDYANFCDPRNGPKFYPLGSGTFHSLQALKTHQYIGDQRNISALHYL